MQNNQKKPGSLVQRILAAIVAAAYFIGFCFWGVWPFSIGLTVVVAAGIYEFVSAYSRVDEVVSTRPQRINNIIAFSAVLIPCALTGIALQYPSIAFAIGAAMCVVIFLMIVRAHAASETHYTLGPFRRHYGWIGLIYVGLLFSSFVLVRTLPGRIIVPPFGEADRGAWFMLFGGICIWTTDTFALIVGKSIGRTPLAPNRSPGKTWEGAVGGLCAAMLVGVAFGRWITLPWQHGLAVAVVASVAGQFGDLFESALKREIGIKDFGRIMPGHGGILDRGDSLLFAIPAVYLYLAAVLRQLH